jgi:preprotein translocase subunit SecD
MLDGMVLTAPIVNNPIHSSDVKMHTGLNPDQARTFSEQLTMGLLPGHLNIIQSETVSENRENGWSRLAISLVAFVITTALAMLVFNSLKNR